MKLLKATSMSSNVTSPRTVFNVLWSSRTFGGAEIYVETMRKRWGTETIALQSLRAMGLLRLALRIAFSRDVFIFHDLRAAVLGFLRPSRRNITVFHGPGKRPRMTKRFVAMSALVQRMVILVADDIAPTVVRDNIEVVQNFSSAGIIANDASADAVFVGRVTASKSVQELVRFWREHTLKGRLHIIGDGDLLPLLSQEYGDGQKIIFHGAVPHAEIAKIASTCRYYVSFSRREGLSLSLLEAMDGGLLPLVTDIPSQQFVFEVDGLPKVTQDLGGLARRIGEIDALPHDVRSTMRANVKSKVHQRFRDSWYRFWDMTLKECRG